MPKGVYERKPTAYRGARHHSWKGTEGRYLNNGYWMLNLGGARVYEHRFIMEKHIGRKLTRSEFVHHRNGDRLDNRLENLELMTIAEHNRLHKKGLPWGHALNCLRRRGGEAQ